MRCEENIVIFKVHFGGISERICVKLIRLQIWGCAVPEKFHTNHRMDWNFLGGEGGGLSESRNFKEMYEA